MRSKLAGGERVKLGQELDDCRTLKGGTVVSAGQVKFHAVASAENDCLAAAPGHQLVEGTGEVLVIESDLLAYLNGSRAVVAAEHQEHHGSPPVVRLCWVTSVISSRANATIVSWATRRPCR